MSNNTTILLKNSTSKDLSFCFSCGFNFGHIADGIEDTTMGMILVGIVMLVVIFSSCLSCYLFYNCKSKDKDTDEEKTLLQGSSKKRRTKRENQDIEE